MTAHAQTVGILYPGELGCALGRALATAGHRVVTTLEGRSARTRHLCHEARLEVLPTLSEVAHVAPLVIAVVPPAAAVEVAQRLALAAQGVEPRPTYVDANSISPQTVCRINSLLAPQGIELVDASIHGLAGRLRTHGTLYLSGPRAGDLAEVFSPLMRVRVLGDGLGTASMAKMLLGGVSKGVVALLVEMSRTAQAAGVFDPFVAELSHYYPGLLEICARLLPTVPCHAARRAGEMAELAQTVAGLGLEPGIVAEVQRLYARLGDAGLEHQPPPAQPSLTAWLELIGAGVGRKPAGAGQTQITT